MNKDKRLIDANVMREDWLENGQNEYVYDTNAILMSIDEQTTVDAVEVVRCKDCVNRGSSYDCPLRKIIVPVEGIFHYEDLTEDDGFCCKGKRKDEET